MIRFGIKLDKSSYEKAEVEVMLQQVVEGMLNEDIIRMQYEQSNVEPAPDYTYKSRFAD